MGANAYAMNEHSNNHACTRNETMVITMPHYMVVLHGRIIACAQRVVAVES